MKNNPHIKNSVKALQKFYLLEGEYIIFHEQLYSKGYFAKTILFLFILIGSYLIIFKTYALGWYLVSLLILAVGISILMFIWHSSPWHLIFTNRRFALFQFGCPCFFVRDFDIENFKIIEKKHWGMRILELQPNPNEKVQLFGCSASNKLLNFRSLPRINKYSEFEFMPSKKTLLVSRMFFYVFILMGLSLIILIFFKKQVLCFIWLFWPLLKKL